MAGADVAVVARRLDRLSEQHRYSRDFTLNSLQQALAEVMACFPVYRTYLRPGSGAVSAADRKHVTTAIKEAKRRNPAVSPSVFDFIGGVLLQEPPDGLSSADLEARRDWVLRFQQMTSPVMAKGLEDTAFYRHVVLASINEVGGDLTRFGTTLEEFHLRNRERAESRPCALSATATQSGRREAIAAIWPENTNVPSASRLKRSPCSTTWSFAFSGMTARAACLTSGAVRSGVARAVTR